MDEQTEEQQRLRLLRAIYEGTRDNERHQRNIFDVAGEDLRMTDRAGIEHIRERLIADGLLTEAGPFGAVFITKRGIEVAKAVPRSFT